MSNEQHAIRAARAFMENMVAESLLASRLGMQVNPREIVSAGFEHIGDSLTSSLPLARLMDQSDVLFHAEGPGAEQDLPWIGALTWLLTTVEINLKKLSAAALDLWGADGKKLGRQVDIRVPGVLPGSIWIGVKLTTCSGPATGRYSSDRKTNHTDRSATSVNPIYRRRKYQ